MARKNERPESPAETLLSFAVTFLFLDVVCPGDPLTSAARWIRRKAAEAAAAFHDGLHDKPVPDEDLTMPEGELHRQAR